MGTHSGAIARWRDLEVEIPGSSKDEQLYAGHQSGCYGISENARSLRQAWRKEQSNIAPERR
jgi:hypothetical protein